MIINDQTPPHLYMNPVVAGETKMHGLVPRDWGTHPHCYSLKSVPFEALEMPLIPRNEWPDRIREKEATKSALSHLRRRHGPDGKHIPSLDQDAKGYCWNHSATMCVMLARAKMNQPYVRLSAFMIGCLVKNYRDEGGWGADALDFITKNGVPSVQFWPEKSMARSNDTPEMRANAKLHMVSEAWVDLTPPVYNRNLTEDQAGTSLLCDEPLIGDFNHWSHSVALMDLVLTSQALARPSMLTTDFDSLDLTDPKDLAAFAAVFGKKGVNSWTDQWGDLGEFTLEGSKAILDGGAAVRVTTASVV